MPYLIKSEWIRILNQLQIEVNEICQVKLQSSLSTSELSPQSTLKYVMCLFHWETGFVVLLNQLSAISNVHMSGAVFSSHYKAAVSSHHSYMFYSCVFGF